MANQRTKGVIKLSTTTPTPTNLASEIFMATIRPESNTVSAMPTVSIARNGRCDNPPRQNLISSIDEVDAVKTQISPMLAVGDGKAAIEFYKSAFGAAVLWSLNDAVAVLSIDGAEFFLADESPQYGTRAPSSAGFTTVRIELFVDDPVAVHRQAVAAGATNHSPVNQHDHRT